MCKVELNQEVSAHVSKKNWRKTLCCSQGFDFVCNVRLRREIVNSKSYILFSDRDISVLQMRETFNFFGCCDSIFWVVKQTTLFNFLPLQSGIEIGFIA